MESVPPSSSDDSPDGISFYEGAAFPAWRRINELTVPPGEWDQVEAAVGAVGGPYPAELVARAQRCLDGFIALLQAEGVVVDGLSAHRSARTSAPWPGPRPRVRE